MGEHQSGTPQARPPALHLHAGQAKLVGVTAESNPTIELPIEIMFFDTDCAAVVHNLAYLRFIEVARTKLGEKLGLDLVGMAETQLYAAVIRTEISYRQAARLGDELVVRGRLDSVERVRFWCAFEVVRPNDNVLLCECRQQLAMMRMPEGKPARLPADWSTRYAHLRAH